MSPRLPAWLALSLLLAAPAHADSRKIWSFKADKGFVDEPMAFSADEARFAYIHTDSAEFMKILVLQIEGLKKELEIAIDDPSRVPKQLAFTAQGDALWLIYMDGHSGAHGALRYDLPGGKLGKKLGPATSAAVADCGGEQCIALTASKTTGQGSTTHTVTAYRTKDGKRLGGGALTVQPDQTMKTPPLRLLYLEPGNLTLLGSQKGKYDKTRDIRLPDRSVRWSVLAKKELWGEEPKELLDWTKVINMRPNHPGQYRFVQVSEDLKELLYVDRDNRLGKLRVPVKWALYEPKSLVQSESPDGKILYFSLTIDPVNAEAVRRKKADRERVDLYRVDEGPRATPLGQVETGKRGFVWSVGSRHFGYLRKLKGFGRGGTEIDLYTIGK